VIIKSVQVKNFRSIADETLECEDLTALVGANGCGKSAFLRALDLFYTATPKVDFDDFYNRNTSDEIVIAITFANLTPEAKEQFSSYIQGEVLTVERLFKWDGSKVTAAYHGSSLQNPEFDTIRFAGSADEKKKAFSGLDSTKYSALPKWKNQGDALAALRKWEADNSGGCVRKRDEGKFFGFEQVGQGYLGRFTRFLFIPAVRDAAQDAAEGKGSVITALMDLVVRSVVANKAELITLREETQRQYKDILDPEKLTELKTLQDDLSITLGIFVPSATVDLSWLPLEELNIPLPKASVRLVEDGYSSAVTRTGHGLQRAFILTLLQRLAMVQSVALAKSGEPESADKPVSKIKLPNLILAIEEPELYQHPSRQRHFSKILRQLASGKTPGVAENTQIIYGTHSPLFVGIDRIDQIRLLRKKSGEPGKPKITKIVRTSLDKIGEIVWKANGESGPKYTGATLIPRLQAILTPWMSEGFFADVVVLVEGEDDRAALVGVAKALNFDLDSLGISVIPCGGKTTLDRPFAIFSDLGIPTFVVWDGDDGEAGAKPEDNHRLLRLLGKPVVNWPSEAGSNFACFKQNLESTMSAEIGTADFNRWLAECQNDFGIPKQKHAKKNPVVISTIVSNTLKAGRKLPTLQKIVESFVALKN
jgi:putative ATP-dependent endonuclease of OLD family